MEVEQQSIPQGNLELFQYENIYQTIPPNLDMNMDTNNRQCDIVYITNFRIVIKPSDTQPKINIYLDQIKNLSESTLEYIKENNNDMGKLDKQHQNYKSQVIQLQKSNIYIYQEKSIIGHNQQQEDSIQIFLATHSKVYQINIQKDFYELFKNAMVSVLYNYLQKKTEEKYVKGIILAKSDQLREMYDKFVNKNTNQQKQQPQLQQQQDVLNISEKDFWENCKDYQAYLNSQARTQVQKEFQKLKIQQNKQKPLEIDKENQLEYTIERGSQNLDQYYDDPYKSDITKINQASIDLYQQQVHLDEQKLKQVNETLKTIRSQSLKKNKHQQAEIQQHQDINNINNHKQNQLDGRKNQHYQKLEEIPQHAVNFLEFKQNLNNLYVEYVKNPNILQMPDYKEKSYQERNKGFKSIYSIQLQNTEQENLSLQQKNNSKTFKKYQSLNFQVTEILQWFYKEVNQFINLQKQRRSQQIQRQNQEQIDKIEKDLEQYSQKLKELEKQLQVYKTQVNDNQNSDREFSLCFSQLSKQLDKGINHYKRIVQNVY